ncbi:hypothetical protein GCM10010305_41140 [Streptomyces termitum]|uniref:Uncharacterized protein n=1 Tax=Streptomyces termitum TaxID=67368 RepID=A0A918T4C8_9ACTN|nr:hypothetical protein GCM10010305_41140 [Streptomyces termitum]
MTARRGGAGAVRGGPGAVLGGTGTIGPPYRVSRHRPARPEPVAGTALSRRTPAEGAATGVRRDPFRRRAHPLPGPVSPLVDPPGPVPGLPAHAPASASVATAFAHR